MNFDAFLKAFVSFALQAGYNVETNTRGQLQVDFGHKKLHSGHLEEMFPEILGDSVSIPLLIEEVAPGRPCAHRPTREIVSKLRDLVRNGS